MAELTDREKKIILIKFIMHGMSPYTELRVEDREKHLIAAMEMLGYAYDKNEMLDLGEAILRVQQQVIDSASGFINSVPAETIARAMKYSMTLFKRK